MDERAQLSFVIIGFKHNKVDKARNSSIRNLTTQRVKRWRDLASGSLDFRLSEERAEVCHFSSQAFCSCAF